MGSYLDFTNSDAFDFWGSQVTEKLLDFGIDATWNDNNEFDIKATDAVAAGFGEKSFCVQNSSDINLFNGIIFVQGANEKISRQASVFIYKKRKQRCKTLGANLVRR